MLDKFKPVGCDTLKSIIDHELGHEIDRAYNLMSDSKIEEIFATWDELSDEKKINALSRYPTTYSERVIRKKEFIADCWAEYRNNPNPRPIAKSVGDRMMETIKDVENKKTVIN